MRINPLAGNPPANDKDQSLVIRGRAGDRKALEELVQRHQGWFYNIAARMLYHPQDAEEVVSVNW